MAPDDLDVHGHLYRSISQLKITSYFIAILAIFATKLLFKFPFFPEDNPIMRIRQYERE
jgi:hypothetical protein